MIKGQGWTLIAQVSNTDEKHWSGGFSGWWQKNKATDPSENKDMISPAFWLVSGNELMITRSDDPHVALLQTTDDCLGGQTLRNKAYTGHDQKDFKYIKCRKNTCNARYGGMYKATQGFAQANSNECSQIGFNCFKWHTINTNRNRAMMTIGAGGADRCSEADHGIGIKRGIDFINSTHHKWSMRMDFGDKTNGSSTGNYSLNLWLR